MIDIEWKKNSSDSGVFKLNFGWKPEDYDHMIELLRRSAPILPTYEEECRYSAILDRMEDRRDAWNSSTALAPEELAELTRCLMEFLLEIDVVMDICQEDQVSYSENAPQASAAHPKLPN